MLHRFILLSDVPKIMYQLFGSNFVWVFTGVVFITMMPHAAWWEIGWGSSVVPPVSISSTSFLPAVKSEAKLTVEPTADA